MRLKRSFLPKVRVFARGAGGRGGQQSGGVKQTTCVQSLAVQKRCFLRSHAAETPKSRRKIVIVTGSHERRANVTPFLHARRGHQKGQGRGVDSALSGARGGSEAVAPGRIFLARRRRIWTDGRILEGAPPQASFTERLFV